MKILAIDTTATTATCALLNDTSPVALYLQNGNLTHSETMLNMVENMLNNAHMTVRDVDMFAVCAGPGSFTGVRIGVSIIKGLAFGSGKPCIPVSTLDALAWHLNGLIQDALIVPVMDARRNQVYTAIFDVDHDGNVTKIVDDCAISIEELQVLIEEHGKNVYFLGDGIGVTQKNIIYNKIKTAPILLQRQNAYYVGLVALEQYKSENTYSDLDLKPTYLRLSQAEREKNEKKENKGVL